MDIGTAKPSAAERAAVPHHLIDILDPAERYSAARFVADATPADRRDRRRAARCRCWSAARCSTSRRCSTASTRCPPADAAVRAALDARGRERRLAGAARRAGAASTRRPRARLAPNDAQRIQRALEVHRVSGRPLSRLAHRASRAPRRTAAADLARAGRSRLAARAHRRALRRRCSTPAWSTRCGRCARAATCIADLPSMRASATARPGPRSTPAIARPALACATRHRRHPPARQAPAHLAARHAAAPGRRLRRARRDRPRRWPLARRPGRALVSRRRHGRARDRLARQALRRGRRSSPTSTSTVAPASSSPSSASRASASRRCSTASPASTASTPAGARSTASTCRALAEPAQARSAPRSPRLRVPGLPRPAAPDVAHNVAPAAAAAGPRGRRARVEAMLAAVGLAGFAARLPQTLSGGQLQRVAIARALVHRPQLILADEPTGNLDPATADRIMTLLAAQVREQRAACLLVTHSRAAAARADRVAHPHAGRHRRRAAMSSRPAFAGDAAAPALLAGAAPPSVAQRRRARRGDARRGAGVLGAPDQRLGAGRVRARGALGQRPARPRDCAARAAGFDEALYARVAAHHPQVALASPVVEAETYAFDAAGERVPLRVRRRRCAGGRRARAGAAAAAGRRQRRRSLRRRSTPDAVFLNAAARSGGSPARPATSASRCRRPTARLRAARRRQRRRRRRRRWR